MYRKPFILGGYLCDEDFTGLVKIKVGATVSHRGLHFQVARQFIETTNGRPALELCTGLSKSVIVYASNVKSVEFIPTLCERGYKGFVTVIAGETLVCAVEHLVGDKQGSLLLVGSQFLDNEGESVILHDGRPMKSWQLSRYKDYYKE